MLISPAAFDARDFVRRALPRLGLLLMFALAALVAGATDRAVAHAALVAADPSDGAVLANAPKAFALTFSEPVSPIVLRLVNADGTRMVLDRFVLHDTRLDIEAPASLTDGTHVLSWRVISEDGHPVGGSVVFSIGAPSAAGVVAAAAPDRPLQAAIWAARVLFSVGLFIGVGGAVFMRAVGGEARGSERIACMALVGGIAAAPLSIGLLGLDALDLPLSQIGARSVWSTGWATTYAETIGIGACAMLAALAALAIHRFTGKALAVLALIGVGLALSASGHASMAPPQWLTRPAVFLHAVCITFWAGALPPLFAALTAPGVSGAVALRRFSRIIPVAVLPLVASGILLAIIQLQGLDALWTTLYGKVFIAKLLLLLPLFAAAALNRLRLTKPAEQGEPAAVRSLRRSIAAELVLVLAIFGVAALWRFTSPPRALAEVARQPAAIHIHTPDAMADVEILPGHAGRVAAAIVVMTGDFGPLDAKALTLTLSNAAAGIEAIRRQATRGADSVWRVDTLDLPVGGRWKLRLAVLVSDFKQVTLEDEIDIRP